jgi:hypothetical protein
MPAFICSACHAPITTIQGFSECGGEGEGVCAITAYAFDTLTDPAAADAAWCAEQAARLPTAADCSAARAAHAIAIVADALWPRGNPDGAEWNADTTATIAQVLTHCGFSPFQTIRSL